MRGRISGEEGEEFVDEVGEGGGDGDGHDPGPDDALDKAPLDGVPAAGGTDAHDAGGDSVGGADGHAQVAGDGEDGGGGGFGGEAVNGFHFDHFVAESFDDAPAAGVGACGHGEGTGDDDPEGDAGAFVGDTEEVEPGGKVVEFTRFGGGEESEHDDAHGFLGIGKPVAEAHVGGAGDLEAAEDLVDGVGAPIANQEKEQTHEDEADGEAKDR